MADTRTKAHWGKVLQYVFGGVLCLLAGITMWAGAPWYVGLGITSIGAMFILGSDRRLFRLGVRRSGIEIICRYVPWYEGFTYFVGFLFGGLGIACAGAGFASGNLIWLRFSGLILLCLSALAITFSVVMWRRCLLCITAPALRVRGVVGASNLTEIRRELVRSIEPKIVTSGLGVESLKVELVYEQAGTSGTTNTVLLGPQITVQPENLLRALVDWKCATQSEPAQLLDRVERLLRGRTAEA